MSRPCWSTRVRMPYKRLHNAAMYGEFSNIRKWKRGEQKLHHKDVLKRHLKTAGIDVKRRESPENDLCGRRRRSLMMIRWEEALEEVLGKMERKTTLNSNINGLHWNRWAAEDDDIWFMVTYGNVLQYLDEI